MTLFIFCSIPGGQINAPMRRPVSPYVLDSVSEVNTRASPGTLLSKRAGLTCGTSKVKAS